MADFTVWNTYIMIYIFTKFSEGTAFLPQGLTYNDEVVGCNTLKKEGGALRNIGKIYILVFWVERIS